MSAPSTILAHYRWKKAVLAGASLAVAGGLIWFGLRRKSNAAVKTNVTFPEKWPGFGNPTTTKLHIIKLNDNTFVLRQDKSTTFEAPFMYLLIGSEKALLIDTGALEEDGGELVRALNQLIPAGVGLLAVHTHPHEDHIAGDKMLRESHELKCKDKLEIITTTLPDNAKLELGKRTVEVITAGSGHSDWDICFLDPSTNLLFVGDVVYPGYLYVRNYDSFQKGIAHLYRRSKGRYAYTMGAHVEMSSCCGLYPSGALHQPDEVNIQQSPDVLERLYHTLKQTYAPMTEQFAITPHSTMK
jgi:hydroxyacylglutathione hydrolase